MNNKIESIKDRLKNYSRNHNKTHQFTLIRYFQERLLFRLSKSKYKTAFLLKGGALIYSLLREASRPTLDLDLLAKNIKSDQTIIQAIFLEICNLRFDDGVIYDAKSISVSEIVKEGNYSGIRIKVLARLGNIKQAMQIDIGFGDVVTPGPVEMEYPTLLEMESPKLLAYSVETLISEKFHAMIDLAEYNSRMKDFYDVYTILYSNNFDEENLKKAIKKTFEIRQTVPIDNHSLFTEKFANEQNKTIQWKAFLKKTNLHSEIEFPQVMKLITTKLELIYSNLKENE